MRLFLLVFVFLQISFSGFCGFSRRFNHYSRNEITGTFEIKNVDNVPEEYKIAYESKGNKIIGYYYNSSVVKFIDELDGNRILKTTYFNKADHEIVYEKFYFYNKDGSIKSFEFNIKNYKDINTCSVKCFFTKDVSDIKFNAVCVIKRGETEQHVISEGNFTKDYKPVKIKGRGINFDNKNLLSYSYSLDEDFSITSDSYSYNLNVNGILHESKEMYTEKGVKLFYEAFYDASGKEKASKSYSLEGETITQVFVTGDEVHIEENSFRSAGEYIFVISYTDFDNRAGVRFRIPDEMIYLDGSVQENLVLPTDLVSMVLFSF